MNKLFWSAFAMSLCLSTLSVGAQTEAIDDFLGLESEILPELTGPQRFSPPELHQKAGWNVQEAEVEKAAAPLKGQSHSLVDWEQDPEDWLSISKWLLERELKDKMPDWKLRLRDERQFEHVGKILQCRGRCEVYRGTRKAKVEHLSRLDEGDELRTEKDSIAWVYLMDGTLVRVGPQSIVAFQELNWSKDEAFHLVRLSQGHVYWHPRNPQDYPLELSPETDAISLPLMVRDANQAHFERSNFQKHQALEDTGSILNVEEMAIKDQVSKLNELKSLNNKIHSPVTRVMMVSPNATIVSKKTSFDLFHYPGGKSHFKKRNGVEGHELVLHLRGYSDALVHSVTDDKWHEIATNGRKFSEVQEVPGALEITELLTARIKTLELAREIWLEKYTSPILKTLTNPHELAVKHGYSLWGNELNRRFDFLVEYTRRIETTNLRSLENLLNKMESNGELVQKEMGDGHYQATLNYYLLGLKNRYTNQRMQVREMSDLQYYIWILRNGKK